MLNELDPTTVAGGGLMGLLTALFWCGYAVFKYLAAKRESKRKEDNDEKDREKSGEEKPSRQKEGEVMDEKKGIQETKEALIAANEIALYVIAHRKANLQENIQDAVAAITGSSDFKQKIEAAIKNADQIPAEIKDIDLMEGIELAKTEYDYSQKIIAALKS